MLKTEHDALVDKVDDLESCSCRLSLRLVGIPEGAEGSDTVKFMTLPIIFALNLSLCC